MVIHFLQCAVFPPILPNLIELFPSMFDGTENVENLEYNLPLNLPGISLIKNLLKIVFSNSKKYA